MAAESVQNEGTGLGQDWDRRSRPLIRTGVPALIHSRIFADVRVSDTGTGAITTLEGQDAASSSVD